MCQVLIGFESYQYGSLRYRCASYHHRFREEVSEQADQARLARIEKYCKTRSYYKGRLTVFNNFLQYGDVKQISARLENLKTIYADFMRIQSKLDACYPQGEPGNERKDFEERYYALVTKATKKIKIFKRQRASLSSLNQAGPSGGQALGSVKEQKMQANGQALPLASTPLRNSNPFRVTNSQPPRNLPLTVTLIRRPNQGQNTKNLLFSVIGVAIFSATPSAEATAIKNSDFFWFGFRMGSFYFFI